MLHPLFSSTLEHLDQLEGSDIVLPHFDSVIAWAIGSHAHQLAQEYDQPIIIDIALPSGQVLFHSPSKNGVVLDNDVWVARKKNTVLRFGKSSFYMGRKLAIKGMSEEQAMYVDLKEYSTHGGSVPIKVNGTDIICGALTVSGLPQQEDHLFALRVLKDIKATLEN